MKALSSLGKSAESYGCLPTSSILSKIPSESKKHMTHDNCNSEWTITKVMAGIFKEIQIYEMSQQYARKYRIDDPIQPTTSSFHTGADNTFNSQDGHQRKDPVFVYFAREVKQVQCSHRPEGEISNCQTRWIVFQLSCSTQSVMLQFKVYL